MLIERADFSRHRPLAGVLIEQTDSHIHIGFEQTRPVLSSAIYNGGLCQAKRLVNLRVSGHVSSGQTPQQTLQDYCRSQSWLGLAVGMMTAASMSSLRVFAVAEQGVSLVVAVTAGVANARAAGDPAEWRMIGEQPEAVGTINTVVMTSASLSPAAMVEVVAVATEAKTVAMRHLDIVSPVSGELATGTGTDAIAVVGGFGPVVEACGKHTLFGELLAQAVIATVTSSVDYQ